MDIFWKGFRIKRCRLGNMNVEKFELDTTSGNENIPEKGFNLDFEEKFNLFSGSPQDFWFFFDFEPKIVPSCEINSFVLFFFDKPKHLISIWIDFNEKYDLGYQLFDFGVLFRKNNHLVIDNTIKRFQFTDKYGAREHFVGDKCLKKLDHSKVIISKPTRIISIIDRDNKLKTYFHRTLILCG
uniref:DUF2958 domain-containing protein n=1 Tax=Strongyloides venezuelensis TaxID=75913 RepID=A0A0K0G285_STRVS